MTEAKSIPAVVLAVLAGVLAASCGDGGSSPPEPNTPLLCRVDGTTRPAMEELARLYEDRTGQKVDIDSAGSGELMSAIQTAQTGDLYVSHDPLLDMLTARGMSRQTWTLATVTPVIVVAKGNPRSIKSVKDLARPGLRLVMTDSANSTTGHLVSVIFGKTGLRRQIEANIAKRSRGSGQAADWVGTGDADAAIVWNAVAHRRAKKLDAIPIDPAYSLISGIDTVTSATGKVYDIGRVKVTIATLRSSGQPEAATRFAEFVMANRAVFAGRFGFSPAPASLTTPKLSLHCDSNMRRAMADAVKAFEKAGGVKVEADYQPGGTQIAAIRLKQTGDLYVPSEAGRLDMLAADGSIEERRNIARLAPVIIVPQGNPKRIASLADLARPGVRLALGHPRACLLGRLCEQLWAKNRIDPTAIRARTVYSLASPRDLGDKVRTNSVDAAIVWNVAAGEFAKDIEVVEIPPRQNVFSHVAVGLLRCSQNRPLARRFMAFLAGPEGQAVFRRHHCTTEATD